MKIDIFNHIFPAGYFEMMMEVAPTHHDLGKRVRNVPMLVDLDLRFRIMDGFGDYRQVLSLAAPPIEVLCGADVAPELARRGNDGMAELVERHRDRFPGFVASLPMNDPEAALAETRRAVGELGACGVQVYSNAAGRPLDDPDFAPIFDAMAAYDLPIWLHPARGANFPDYLTEDTSKYEIWWTFGWPYETSAAMARLVFSGLFDRHPDLKIITHHMGAMAPLFRRPRRPRMGPARQPHDRRGLRRTFEVAAQAAARLLQDVLRRHRPVRLVRRDGVRARVLRGGSRPVRLRYAVRSRGGGRCTSARPSASSTGSTSARATATRFTGVTRNACSRYR